MAFTWFRRRRLPFDAPRLRPRRERRPGIAVDVSAIAPEVESFLGQAACIQLSAFERLSSLVTDVPGFAAKESVGVAAGHALARHQRIVAELKRIGADPDIAMQPFAAAVAAFERATRGADWIERLLGARICSGLLDDFFAALAAGVQADGAHALPSLFEADPDEGAALERILLAQLAGDPRLGSRLAMWGRRLVGDTILVARSALRLSGDVDADEAHTEPLFAEVIATHTRRMDALGLTA